MFWKRLLLYLMAAFLAACMGNAQRDSGERGCSCRNRDEVADPPEAAVAITVDEAFETLGVADSCVDVTIWGDMEISPTALAGAACKDAGSVDVKGAIAFYYEGHKPLFDVYVTEKASLGGCEIPIGAITISDLEFFLEKNSEGGDDIWAAGYDDDELVFEGYLVLNEIGLWTVGNADYATKYFDGTFSGVEEYGYQVPREECDS